MAWRPRPTWAPPWCQGVFPCDGIGPRPSYCRAAFHSGLMRRLEPWKCGARACVRGARSCVCARSRDFSGGRLPGQLIFVIICQTVQGITAPISGFEKQEDQKRHVSTESSMFQTGYTSVSQINWETCTSCCSSSSEPELYISEPAGPKYTRALNN